MAKTPKIEKEINPVRRKIMEKSMCAAYSIQAVMDMSNLSLEEVTQYITTICLNATDGKIRLDEIVRDVLETLANGDGSPHLAKGRKGVWHD